ncbi:thioredoxin domain-containing protein [Streptomyces sp. NPDC051940]|uniref:thioredoxin domain-containing protein n=1 Tax=Streptomyces sp. NPDC051940 TaxID=3155675 RepID=UPI00343E92EE
MSKRNSQEAKRAARERLRVERERQAKKDKTRRQILVGGAVVAVLALGAGIAIAVNQMGGDDDKPLVKPANTAGKDGTDLFIGDNTKNTLRVYEDPRCPVCAQFEQSAGETVLKGMEDGKYRLQFTLATFLDNNLTGSGSANAVNALGAALNVSTDAFLEYKTALYSKDNHPEESDDKFADDAYLLKIADQVDALKDNAAFEKDVKEGTYDTWAKKMAATFDQQGTPTLLLNGEKLTVPGTQNTPMTADDFTKALDAKLK